MTNGLAYLAGAVGCLAQKYHNSCCFNFLANEAVSYTGAAICRNALRVEFNFNLKKNVCLYLRFH
jgi:hypothetical protein